MQSSKPRKLWCTRCGSFWHESRISASQLFTRNSGDERHTTKARRQQVWSTLFAWTASHPSLKCYMHSEAKQKQKNKNLCFCTRFYSVWSTNRNMLWVKFNHRCKKRWIENCRLNTCQDQSLFLALHLATSILSLNAAKKRGSSEKLTVMTSVTYNWRNEFNDENVTRRNRINNDFMRSLKLNQDAQQIVFKRHIWLINLLK